MFQYHCLNPISPVGLEKFPGKYENTEELAQADAIFGKKCRYAQPGACR